MAVKKDRLCKWVKALESGKFKKALTNLRIESSHGTSYCALGVACKVWENETGKEADYNTNYLPTNIRKWYGLNDQSPMLDYDGERNAYRISFLNDIKKISLKKIAKCISETYGLDCNTKEK